MTTVGAPDTSRIRVLLADDHRLVREALGGMLRGQVDVELVGEASDAAEAVALTQRLQPDVVVMDVAMPGGGGVAATEHIVATVPATRVIGLSGHDEPRLVAAMIDAGAAGYVLKDCAFDELVYALRVTMRNHCYLSPAIAGVVVQGFRRQLREDTHDVFGELTPREREVALLLAQGYTTKQAAWQLGVSPKTVGTHREHAMAKLQVRSIAELTRCAIAAGLV